MTEIVIYLNEFNNYSLETFSFESTLHMFGTTAQTNVLKTKGLTPGSSTKVIIKTEDEEIVEEVEGKVYLVQSSIQELYGTATCRYSVSIRKLADI